MLLQEEVLHVHMPLFFLLFLSHVGRGFVRSFQTGGKEHFAACGMLYVASPSGCVRGGCGGGSISHPTRWFTMRQRCRRAEKYLFDRTLFPPKKQVSRNKVFYIVQLRSYSRDRTAQTGNCIYRTYCIRTIDHHILVRRKRKPLITLFHRT